MLGTFNIYEHTLEQLPVDKKLLISTINAYSYNISKSDRAFNQALHNSNILIPDGISIVVAIKWLKGKTIKKIAGADLFYYEMNRLQSSGGKCLFLGSSNAVLQKIKQRALIEFSNVEVEIYSPPYKPKFSAQDNQEMINIVSQVKPDVLFVGMTAPKQEKWAYEHLDMLNCGHICCIGAVFDFYAGTVKRAPVWMIGIGLEWLYRLLKEPKRMWRRYLIGNFQFVWNIIVEKLKHK